MFWRIRAGVFESLEGFPAALQALTDLRERVNDNYDLLFWRIRKVCLTKDVSEMH